MSARLLGRSDTAQCREYALADTTLIGSAENSDVQLDEAEASPVHAAIVRDGARAWLEDKSGARGTYLNGRRVSRESLRHLDVITIGRVDLVYVEQ